MPPKGRVVIRRAPSQVKDTKSAADRGRAKGYGLPRAKDVKPKRWKPAPKVEAPKDTKAAADLKRPAPKVGDTKSDLKRPAPKVGDTKGAGEFRKAERGKRTPEYRAAVRAGYDASDRRRSAAVAAANYNLAKSGRRKLTEEDRVVLHTRLSRRERNEDLARDAAQRDNVTRKDLDAAATERKRLKVPVVKPKTPASKTARNTAESVLGNVFPGGKLARKIVTEGGKQTAATGKAFVEAPGKTTKATAKGAKEMVYGLPAGVVEAVRHPIKTAKATVKDYDRRYSGSVKQRAERIKKEGAAAEILDAVGVTTAGGATAGRAVTRAAKKGYLGDKRKAIVTEPRPAMRTSGSTRDQKLSPNYFKAAAQRKHDEARARLAERHRARGAAGQGGADAVRVVAATRNKAAGKTVEVTPLRKRKLDKEQRVGVARLKSRAVRTRKLDLHRDLGQTRREFGGLSKHERRAFSFVSRGIVPASAADNAAGVKKHLEKRIAAMRRARKEDGYQPRGLFKRVDSLKEAEYLLAHADEAFTPRLKQAVDNLREQNYRVASEDPRLTDTQARLRRAAQQAEHLGIRHGEVVDGSGWKEAQGSPEVVRRIDEAIARLEAQRRQRQPSTRPEIAAQSARLSDSTEVGRPARADADYATDIDGMIERLRAERRRHEPYLEFSRPGRRYDPDETVDSYLKRVDEARQKEGLEEPLYFPSERYATDVAPDFAAYAVGGMKAMGKPFRYKGKNFRLGLEDTSPETYIQGLARNKKAKHNLPLVRKILDEHALPGFGGGPLKALRQQLAEAGVDPSTVAFWNPRLYDEAVKATDEIPQTAGERRAQEVVDDQDFDGDRRHAAMRIASAADPRALKRASMDLERQADVLRELARRDSDNPRAQEQAFLNPGERTAEQFEQDVESLNLPDAQKDRIMSDYNTVNGWVAVPRAAYKELEDSTRPSGMGGRSVDVMRTKASRLLLGAGNIPWLQFQVASNAILGGFATHGSLPVDMVRAAVLWHKKLTPEERDAIDADLGTGASADAAQVRIGAASNNHFLNFYRAFKKAPFWHAPRAKGRGPSISQINPIELMFAADRAQTSAFRRGVLYNQAKREAFQRMTANMSLAEKAQAKILSAFKLDPDDMVSTLLKDPVALERHAEAVDSWLGDYVTYTARERKTLGRFTMFYGFLRHSTRLAFHTLPLEHPIIASMMLKLGQLHAEEIRDLLGPEAGIRAFATVYDVKDGKVVGETELLRAHPLLNNVASVFAGAATGDRATQAAQLLTMAPPPFVWGAEQLMHRSLYKGRDWNVRGKRMNYEDVKDSDYGLEDRARILGNNVSSLAYPLREWMKLDAAGRTLGDDSLPGDVRPTRFSKGKRDIDKLIRRSQKDRARFAEQQPVGQRLLNDTFPLKGLLGGSGTPSRAQEEAALDRKIEAKKRQMEKNKGKGRKKSKAKYFGSGQGGTGSGYFGG